MPIDAPERDRLAQALYEAYHDADPISPITDDIDVTIDDAYDIQHRWMDRRVEDGATVIGHKIGLTSEGIQRQLGVSNPDFGQILDTMLVEDGTLDASGLIAPRIEPELAFVLGEALEPPVTTLSVVQATDAIVPILEVIDSRIQDWNIEVADTIADNASSSHVVLGTHFESIEGFDPTLEGVVLRRNGDIVDHGVGAAVMGNPLKAVAWLANTLDQYDQRLHRGDLVLSGAMTPTIDLEPGDTVSATYTTVGSVSVSIY